MKEIYEDLKTRLEFIALQMETVQGEIYQKDGLLREAFLSRTNQAAREAFEKMRDNLPALRRKLTKEQDTGRKVSLGQFWEPAEKIISEARGCPELFLRSESSLAEMEKREVQGLENELLKLMARPEINGKWEKISELQDLKQNPWVFGVNWFRILAGFLEGLKKQTTVTEAGPGTPKGKEKFTVMEMMAIEYYRGNNITTENWSIIAKENWEKIGSVGWIQDFNQWEIKKRKTISGNKKEDNNTKRMFGRIIQFLKNEPEALYRAENDYSEWSDRFNREYEIE